MSLADIYMKIARQNQAERDQMRKQLEGMAGSVASIIQANQTNKANRMLNEIDPPRAAAVDPKSPAAKTADSLYGGPTKPHTGGLDELEQAMNLYKADKSLQQDEIRRVLEANRRRDNEKRLQQMAAIAREEQDREAGIARPPENAANGVAMVPPGGIVRGIRNGNSYAWNGNSYVKEAGDGQSYFA